MTAEMGPNVRKAEEKTSTVSAARLCAQRVDEDQSPGIFSVFLSLTSGSDKNVSLLWSPVGVKPFSVGFDWSMADIEGFSTIFYFLLKPIN